MRYVRQALSVPMYGSQREYRDEDRGYYQLYHRFDGHHHTVDVTVLGVDRTRRLQCGRVVSGVDYQSDGPSSTFEK